MYSQAPDLAEEPWGLRVQRGVQQLCLQMIKPVIGMSLVSVSTGTVKGSRRLGPGRGRSEIRSTVAEATLGIGNLSRDLQPAR